MDDEVLYQFAWGRYDARIWKWLPCTGCVKCGQSTGDMSNAHDDFHPEPEHQKHATYQRASVVIDVLCRLAVP